MARRVVDVLVPVALDRAYSYRVPEEFSLAPGDIVSVPLGARETTAVVWADNPKPNPRLDNRLKDVEEKLELPPLKPELRSFVDWVANYTVIFARHGAAHVPAHGRASRPGARARRRQARGLAAAAHDRRAPARAGAARRRHDAREKRSRARGWRQRRRDRRPDRRRHAGNCRAAARAGRRKTRSRFHAARIHRRPERRRRGAESDGRQGRLCGDAARRRHRLGQDRSLFRSGCRHDPKRPAKPHSDAGDRAHRAIPRPLCRALRRSAGGMAFRTVAAQARAHVASCRRRRSRRRRRRAVRSISALCRSRIDRRR